MSLPVRQLVADFLAEREESVGEEAFRRLADVCGAMLESLDAQGVTDASELELGHVSGFLLSAAPRNSDVFFTVKSFVKWLGRRKYAKRLSEDFAECEGVLREQLKSRAAEA